MAGDISVATRKCTVAEDKIVEIVAIADPERVPRITAAVIGEEQRHLTDD